MSEKIKNHDLSLAAQNGGEFRIRNEVVDGFEGLVMRTLWYADKPQEATSICRRLTGKFDPEVSASLNRAVRNLGDFCDNVGKATICDIPQRGNMDSARRKYSLRDLTPEEREERRKVRAERYKFNGFEFAGMLVKGKVGQVLKAVSTADVYPIPKKYMLELVWPGSTDINTGKWLSNDILATNKFLDENGYNRRIIFNRKYFGYEITVVNPRAEPQHVDILDRAATVVESFDPEELKAAPGGELIRLQNLNSEVALTAIQLLYANSRVPIGDTSFLDERTVTACYRLVAGWFYRNLTLDIILDRFEYLRDRVLNSRFDLENLDINQLSKEDPDLAILGFWLLNNAGTKKLKNIRVAENEAETKLVDSEYVKQLVYKWASNNRSFVEVLNQTDLPEEVKRRKDKKYKIEDLDETIVTKIGLLLDLIESRGVRSPITGLKIQAIFPEINFGANNKLSIPKLAEDGFITALLNPRLRNKHPVFSIEDIVFVFYLKEQRKKIQLVFENSGDIHKVIKRVIEDREKSKVQVELTPGK